MGYEKKNAEKLGRDEKSFGIIAFAGWVYEVKLKEKNKKGCVVCWTVVGTAVYGQTHQLELDLCHSWRVREEDSH